MSRVKLHPTSAPYQGLWLAGGKDSSPQGSFRRLIGVHRIHTGPLRSRSGSTLVASLTAHSLYRFGTARFAGVGTALYRNGVQIYNSFGGGRLAFVRMAPQPGKTDSLFVTDGTKKIKVDTAGNVTNWGIDAPPDGFTATLNTAMTTQIDNLDVAATWTGSGAALADEATIKQEGTNSMKMTVVASTTGTATKAIAINLSQYAGPVSSPDEDYIQIWARVDNPTNVNFLQLDFDVGGGAFTTDYYTKILVPTNTALSQKQLSSQALGIVDLFSPTDVTDLSTLPLDPTTLQSQLDTMGQVGVTPSAGVWVRLRIPKKTFSRIGTNGNTWANVQAVRLTLQTNSNGTAIVFWDDLRMSGGAGMQGDYGYQVTFKNSTTGSRSNANPTQVVLTGNQRQSVTLSNLPISTDPQVNAREIWRTLGGGTLSFLAATINDNTTTTYVDSVADYTGLNSITGAAVLANTQLPTDNATPPSTMSDAVGPFLGQMWWLDSANPGNVYYSPIGRPESNLSFVQVTNTDDPCQKLVIWNGLWVVTQKTIYQIQGTSPAYTAQVILGTQGTTKPYTVQACPYGIFYQSDEGVRAFNGTASQLVRFDPVAPIFNGETVEGIASFVGLVGGYGREEYLISDGVATTLALNVAKGTWRNLGVVGNAFWYEWDTKELQMAVGAKILLFEATTLVYTDDSAAIPFTAEWSSILADDAQSMTVTRLYFDIDTQGQLITPTIIADAVETVLPQFSTSGRNDYEIALMTNARLFGVRLNGNFTKQVQVCGLSLDLRISRIIGGKGEQELPQLIQATT